ncbi:hypothetical protein O181_011588 [Austropuccinia psidii MF-1]|uniref:BED-type domain-containing protein n=1 Tax=Austropuccinia psidii MF-1 TaxID=1389203 RepID=A0A9Q3BV56_9BASI|nr:hypothetical protein [Austropuccinia psidii MF-1]
MPCLWILNNDLIGLNTNPLVTIGPDDTLVIQSDSQYLLGIHIPLQFGRHIELPIIDINSNFCDLSMDQLTELSSERNSSADNYDNNFNHCNVEETNSPPKTGTQQRKRRCKRSEVYNYFEKLTDTRVWIADKKNYRHTYKCRHCSVKIGVMGGNTSNMNKHRKKCGGQFDAWALRSPGSIDPSMGARLDAKAQQHLTKELVKALVAIQMSSSIFESPRLCKILNEITPLAFDSSNCYSALLQG